MKTGILSLVITLALAIAGAYYFEQYQHFVVQSQQRQSKLQSELDNDIKPSIAKLETKLQDVKQDQHWKISEVIYLLRLSIEQLKITQDVQTSLHLLQAADEQLKTLQDPTLAPIREMIMQERNALQNVKFPDIQGLWSTIGLMIDKVNALPTRGVNLAPTATDSTLPTSISSHPSAAGDTSADNKNANTNISANTGVSSSTNTHTTNNTNSNTNANTNTNINISNNPTDNVKTDDTVKTDWKDNLKKTLSKLNDIVKIQRHTKPIEPILPEYEQAIAKENLRLLLEQLRWSVLNKQTQIFQSLLKEIDQSLESYFDNTDENVKNMRASLKTMSTIDLRPALPELGQALQLLQKR